MQQSFHIKKVAVLGAGVMGAQIAAHCVNAGIETLLFDLAAPQGDADALVSKAIANLAKLKPSPLATAETVSLLQAKNYEHNLNELVQCELIIEAIAERLDWKEELYKRIAPYTAESSILVSNTSGLSINSLSSVLPENLRRNFCGVHFFNPPRYMHLAELIPAKTTTSELLDYLESWLTSTLGKGVVRAKDTPNFIANRIGVFSILASIHHAEALGLGLDEVDALTGPLIGRPKSATFRTMDVVGLDTMQHVVNTMDEQLINDPWHAMFKLPAWLNELIKIGSLGQKSGQGIYRKNGKTIEVLDLKTKTYRPAKGELSDELKKIMKIPNHAERMQLLSQSKDKQAKFLSACFRDLLHYCAYHLEDIAHSVREVDLAIRWGFGWRQGPFETWQSSGFAEIKTMIEQGIATNESLNDAELPTWLEQISEFYSEQGAYSPKENSLTPSSQLAVYQRQFFPDRVLKETVRSTPTLFENEAVHLWHLKDEVAVLNFKSKANTIGQAVLDGMEQALDLAESKCQGLIIYQQDASNFSSGADLRSVATLIQAGKLAAVDSMISQFQRAVLKVKYSTLPVIAALRGRALGGGCELMMHCDGVVAAFESYPGLVEVGVGLLPAGGGCKEFAMRAAAKAQNADLMLFISPYFQQIATAFVAGSAPESLEKGYLCAKDYWVMHADEVLYAALARIKSTQAANYQPALKSRFKVAGREGHARLQAGLINWLEGGFISQHDYLIANHIAQIICGGEVNQNELVDENWILKLEKQAFMELAATPLTQARIAHLLETGKPLRN
ncbi:MAG: 3-hydroxyacyl-CoA dehydrogenase/enoyl-CoA hydratase family protein [Tatlockia sp.]|nr:3-hydroxyacyl-CoA dehydrogenase/enoyl-CoA hydratase family protein [Tatlockia sp.]